MFQEDQEVTLQVAMIGSDGWVLASDRVRVSPGPRLRSSVNKIVLHEEAGLAYSFFGDDVAAMVGDQLSLEFPKLDVGIEKRSDFRSWLFSLGNREWAKMKDAYPSLLAGSDNRGLLVFVRNSPERFWLFGIGERSLVMEQQTTKNVVGDAPNTARFFPDYYYSNRVTVAQLTYLAVHTINIGALMNPTGIGLGIDVLTYHAKTGKFDWVEPEKIDALRKRSDKLTQKIRREFFGKIMSRNDD